MIPKEHGAYFQLAAPVITALAMGRPTGSAFLFVLSAAAGFLAHESLLVLIGGRGGRAKRDEGDRAARWLTVLAALALASGTAAWSIAPVGMGALPLVPLAMAAVVSGLVFGRFERKMLGEILVGAALASAALPVACAAGVASRPMWTAWLAWIIAAGAGTCAVRSIIRSPRESARTPRLVLVAAIVVAAAGIASQWPIAALAAGPTIILAIVWTVAPPHPRRLRQVGWSLAGATLAGSVILVASVRRDGDLNPSVSGEDPTRGIHFSQSEGETR